MIKYLYPVALVAWVLAWSTPAEAAPKKDGRTLLKIQVDPPSKIFVDGKPRGAGKSKTIELSPGAHIIRVVHKKDEHEERVILKRGETTEWSWRFEDAAPPKAAPAADGPEGDGAPRDDAPPDSAPANGDPAPELSPLEKLQQQGSGEPRDPPVENPRRGAKHKAPKKDPLEGIDAPGK
jgi:hypothetical protein